MTSLRALLEHALENDRAAYWIIGREPNRCPEAYAVITSATPMIKFTYALQAVAVIGIIVSAVGGAFALRQEAYQGLAINAVAFLVNACGFVLQIYFRRREHRREGHVSKPDCCPHCGARDWATLHRGEWGHPESVCRACWRRPWL